MCVVCCVFFVCCVCVLCWVLSEMARPSPACGVRLNPLCACQGTTTSVPCLWGWLNPVTLSVSVREPQRPSPACGGGCTLSPCLCLPGNHNGETRDRGIAAVDLSRTFATSLACQIRHPRGSVTVAAAAAQRVRISSVLPTTAARRARDASDARGCRHFASHAAQRDCGAARLCYFDSCHRGFRFCHGGGRWGRFE